MVMVMVMLSNPFEDLVSFVSHLQVTTRIVTMM